MKFEVSGEPIHTRCLATAFTQGVGDSVEFRADILDLRKGGLMELAGRISAAGIIHKMELRGAFVLSTGEIERIEWHQSHVMHEANRATKGECCRDPMARLEGLVGTCLGEGFAASLKQCFGGPLGCTHINTLFQELSAFAGRLRGVHEGYAGYRGARRVGDRLASRSVYFDAFLASEGGSATDLSVRLADIFYAPADEDGRERLFLHDEVRLLAEVDLAGWQIKHVQARERSRRGPICVDSPWQTRTGELADFAGQSLGGGMARLCLARFGERVRDARLLSALLSLGPGMTQVGVAVSNTLAPSSTARPLGAGLSGPGPCYMLRAEGPLMESLYSVEMTNDDTPPD